jgi:hypothetical protein
MATNIENWFEDKFENDWQPIEQILQEHPVFSSRFAVSNRSPQLEIRGKKVGGKFIGLQQPPPQLHLLIKDVEVKNNGDRDILVKIYPPGSKQYVPEGLELIILEESGDVFMEARARNNDNWIQLNFLSHPEEQYSIKVIYGDATYVEEFSS